MAVLACVTDDVGCKILNSLNPIQAILSTVAPNIITHCRITYTKSNQNENVVKH